VTASAGAHPRDSRRFDTDEKALPGEEKASLESSLRGDGLGFEGDAAGFLPAALEAEPFGVDLLGEALGAGDLARLAGDFEEDGASLALGGDLAERFFAGDDDFFAGDGDFEVDGSSAATTAAGSSSMGGAGG